MRSTHAFAFVVLALALGPVILACSRTKEVAHGLPADTQLLGAFAGRVYWASGETLSWIDDALAQPESLDVEGVDWATRANFAADASGVYFSHHNRVSRIPTRAMSERAPSPEGWVNSDALDHPTGVAVDGESVYVLNLDVGCLDRGSVIALARRNGRTISRADAPANGLQPVEFAIDGDFYYWIDGIGGERESSRRDRKIMALPRRAGTAVVVAANEGNPTDLAIGPSGVYWRTRKGIRFAAKSPSGFGVPSTLVSEPSHGSPAPAIASLLANANDLFFTAADGIYELSRGSSEPRRIAAQPGAKDLVADGKSLYWLAAATTGNQRTIVRAPRP